MAYTQDQIAALNFGYLNGSDLLQFCPPELLIQKYSTSPFLFQAGCNQAYSYVKAKLCNRYDLNSVLSNSNQSFKKQSANFTAVIAAGTYVSRISFNSQEETFNESLLGITPLPPEIYLTAVSPIVKVGTTLGGEEICSESAINKNLVKFINKYFANQTTLYFTITSNQLDVDITATTGVTMPSISPLALMGKTGAFSIVIPANTYFYQLFGNIVLSTPSITIGTTPGGNEILHTTLISTSALIPLTHYFANSTTLYFNVTGGTADLKLDLGHQFIAPQPQVYTIKDETLTRILAICAIESILGSAAATNKMMQGLYEKNEQMIHEIQNEQMGLPLPSQQESLTATPKIVNSSFKLIG